MFQSSKIFFLCFGIFPQLYAMDCQTLIQCPIKRVPPEILNIIVCDVIGNSNSTSLNRNNIQSLVLDFNQITNLKCVDRSFKKAVEFACVFFEQQTLNVTNVFLWARCLKNGSVDCRLKNGSADFSNSLRIGHKLGFKNYVATNKLLCDMSNWVQIRETIVDTIISFEEHFCDLESKKIFLNGTFNSMDNFYKKYWADKEHIALVDPNLVIETNLYLRNKSLFVSAFLDSFKFVSSDFFDHYVKNLNVSLVESFKDSDEIMRSILERGHISDFYLDFDKSLKKKLIHYDIVHPNADQLCARTLCLAQKFIQTLSDKKIMERHNHLIVQRQQYPDTCCQHFIDHLAQRIANKRWPKINCTEVMDEIEVVKTFNAQQALWLAGILKSHAHLMKDSNIQRSLTNFIKSSSDADLLDERMITALSLIHFTPAHNEEDTSGDAMENQAQLFAALMRAYVKTAERLNTAAILKKNQG